MKELKKIIPLVKEAGEILLKFHKSGFNFDYKGPRDLVTEADITVENFIKTCLFELYPDIPFLGEETGGTNRYDTCFILDPLDGTTNFAHGYPAFCISLAYIENNDIVWGVILDPLRGELFRAEKGKGAFLNTSRLKVSAEPTLKRSLLATGFPYRDSLMAPILNYFNHILPHCQGIRRGGAAALDLAYTACGRLDGFFELGLKPWDVAAGILLVREAGGIVTNINGETASSYDGNFVAANSLVHEEIMRHIRRADESLDVFTKYFKGAALGED